VLATIEDIETHFRKVGLTAVRIGQTLSSTESQRQKAEHAQRLLQYFLAFQSLRHEVGNGGVIIIIIIIIIIVIIIIIIDITIIMIISSPESQRQKAEHAQRLLQYFLAFQSLRHEVGDDAIVTDLVILLSHRQPGHRVIMVVSPVRLMANQPTITWMS
jgi:hypothetical protein